MSLIIDDFKIFKKEEGAQNTSQSIIFVDYFEQNMLVIYINKEKSHHNFPYIFKINWKTERIKSLENLKQE